MKTVKEIIFSCYIIFQKKKILVSIYIYIIFYHKAPKLNKKSYKLDFICFSSPAADNNKIRGDFFCFVEYFSS